LSLSPETSALQNLVVQEALSTLRPRQRAVLLLKEWEGWSAAEIAATLRCSPRRVFYELDIAHRALAAWRGRTGHGTVDNEGARKEEGNLR
jgi:DNA-directed RNA polymerase specialized sigma24 family protein